jgi:hypothetical protein
VTCTKNPLTEKPKRYNVIAEEIYLAKRTLLGQIGICLESLFCDPHHSPEPA